MEAISQKDPLSTIKPIKYSRQTLTVNPQDLPKYRVYHPKNLKMIYFSRPSAQDQSLKGFAKILETQNMISSANYLLHEKTAFQNCFFSSKIRKLSTSLSSFQLETWDQFNFKTSKGIFRSLTSLRNLHNFDILLMFCQFPATNDLYSLFGRLAYLKKMKHFSFYPCLCTGFESTHWSALCSSLIRAPQLQDLNLTFNGGDKFLEILIPALSKLRYLAKLRLSFGGDNQIPAENISQLFLTLSTIKTLTDITLRLAPCRIAHENTILESFAEGLQYLNASSIRELSLDLYKNLTGKGLVQISQILRKFTALKILHIGLPDSQEIFDEGLTQLSSTISELGGSLTSLGLCVSGLSRNLALALKSLPNLIDLSLNLQDPNPSHDQVQHLSSSLRSLKPSLKFLHIKFARQNSLSDLMIENLGEALKELSLLKSFSLNLILASEKTPKGIKNISKVIQRLSNLSCLELILANDPGLVEKSEKIVVDQISSEEKGLQSLFGILCEMKNLYQLQMMLPAHCGFPLEMTKLKQRFNPRINETKNYLKIMKL